jgi:hypothetical protein
MGKVRLDCPNCGKAIAVSDTAKEARCPGCKEVIEADQLADSPESAEAEQEAVEDTEVPDTDDDDAGGEAEEEGAKKKRSSKRVSSRRISQASRGQPGGSQGILISIGAAVVVAGVLAFLIFWPIAIVVASGIMIYLDATLARITRMSSSGQGTSSAPMLWGLLGFLFPVGPIIYFVMRNKLLSASAEDIGDTSLSDDDLEDVGKVREPTLASAGSVVMAAAAVALSVLFWAGPSVRLTFGKTLNPNNPTPQGAKWDDTGKKAYDQGVIFCARLTWAVPPERLDAVVCKAYHLTGGEQTEALEKTVPIPEVTKNVYWLMELPEPGNYRIEVYTPEPESSKITSETIRIRETM